MVRGARGAAMVGVDGSYADERSKLLAVRADTHWSSNTCKPFALSHSTALMTGHSTALMTGCRSACAVSGFDRLSPNGSYGFQRTLV